MNLLSISAIATKLKNYRPEIIDSITAPIRAGVGIIIRSGSSGAELLFIKRAEHPADPWSGHIAFPGGRFDQTQDQNIADTVLREVSEEINVSLQQSCRYLGRTDDIRAVGRGKLLPMAISVLVYETNQELEPRLNAEVVCVFWVPLAELIADYNVTLKTYTFEGNQYELPAIKYNGQIIWGLTLRMLLNLFDILGIPLPSGKFEFPERWNDLKELIRHKREPELP